MEFVVDALLPAGPADFSRSRPASVGWVGLLDPTGDMDTISEELDFVGRVAGLTYEFPLADWLVGHTALDGVGGG